MEDGMGRTWFITGISSGIGKALVSLLLAKGENVAGTTRSIMALSLPENKNFLPLEVDLRSEVQIAKAVEAVMKRFHRIDVVVNNAGYSINGAIEELSMKEIQDIFDINVFSPIRVIRQTAEILRGQKSGLYVNISSMGGLMASPIVGIYCSTKFALNAVSETIGKELEAFNIHSVSIMPGQVRTGFMGSNMQYAAEKKEAYEELRAERMDAIRKSHNHQVGDPEALARAIVEISLMKYPPKRFFAGRQALDHALKMAEETMSEVEDQRELSLSTEFR